MRNMKFFMIFASLLFSLIIYKTYEEYKNIQNTQKLIILNESQSLSKFVSSFRQTYQDIFLYKHIEVNDKTINLLPVKTIGEISNRFLKSVKGDVVIRTVSDRPRNIKNMANDFELEMINYFKKNPKTIDNFIQKKDTFYYSKPLYIKQSCLKCHGKREDTIPSVRNKYKKAYNYKIGELRGLLNIKIKKHKFFSAMYSNFIEKTIITIVVFFIFLIIIYKLFQIVRKKEEDYTKELETDIAIKTNELEKQKEIFETLFEKSSDGILILDKDKFIQCNEKIVKMLGYGSKSELLNVHPSELSPEFQPDGRDSYSKAEEMISLAFKNNGHQFEWIHRKANGDDFISEITLTPIVLNNHKVLYVVWRDISEKKEAEEKLIEQKDILYHQAHHDTLTGLPNRILFNDRLEHGIELAKRHNVKLALLFIDLDHFKQINDSLGHQIGDRVLVAVAERLKAKIRKEDTLARLGGDEFTIIMGDLVDMQSVSILAHKLLNILTQPIHIGGHTFYISCSIGISLYPQDDYNADNLLKYADAAMYKAKEEGRNNFQFYSSEMTTLALNRVIMEADLRKALNKDEFSVYYQPQIDINTEKLIGVEALIRWWHPEKGFISPNKFIALAEETGLIIEIDQWVMKTAMQQISKWYQDGFSPGVLALNLSMRELRNDDFIEILSECMKRNNFKPEWLELEIVERHVMEKPEESIIKLNQISAMGVALAVDDFGTGHSSLAYLKKLPLYKLKIDRSFVKGIPENKEDVSIVNAIIALAKSLKLELIAEGVETYEQKEFLKENGCTNVQGYYYGKPMPDDDIKKKYL